jgi:hypothetical protein
MPGNIRTGLNTVIGEEEAFSLKRLLEGSDVTKYGKRYWMNIVRGPLYVDYEPAGPGHRYGHITTNIKAGQPWATTV